jgi:hypothetical protein
MSAVTPESRKPSAARHKAIRTKEQTERRSKRIKHAKDAFDLAMLAVDVLKALGLLK